MTKKQSHEHHSGSLIRAQVAYGDGNLALAGARAIISRKITNGQRLLTAYYQSCQRAKDDRAWQLQATLNRLTHLASTCLNNQVDKPELFHLEAQAARLYWSSLALLGRQSNDWQRVYPHATDTLNVLLNTGYTILARKCLRAIITAGLLPEIGLLHGNNSSDPLVYDLMEIFRHLTVDAVILPIFSRRQKQMIDKSDPAFTRILYLLNQRYQKHFWYKQRCESLENIIGREAVSLRQALLSQQVWEPYRHHWGRHHVCK